MFNQIPDKPQRHIQKLVKHLKMELFVKIVNDFYPLPIFTESSTLDAGLISKYVSVPVRIEILRLNLKKAKKF